MNDTLRDRIMYMDNIVHMLTEEVSSVYTEAIIEEDEEDFLLAHLLNEKTVDLAFVLLDIVKEELDELKELEISWYKDAMLNPDGNISIDSSSDAKSENGWDTEILSSAEEPENEDEENI